MFSIKIFNDFFAKSFEMTIFRCNFAARKSDGHRVARGTRCESVTVPAAVNSSS